ncbi:MAG: N-6 DNA methylase [Acidobacteria bacterium]|nr:N-6 DNA methylase [Acidobacteriota bacterium]
MRHAEPIIATRDAARAYEAALPPSQRKRLGQYFTGLRLGKLLAHLALDSSTRTTLDPMAGHGDLLDAVAEASAEQAISSQRLDGIEIDENAAALCRSRLTQIGIGEPLSAHQIIAGDAFDAATVDALPHSAYDLVITNPPYVRYQTTNGDAAKPKTIRSGLLQIIDRHLAGTPSTVWSELATSYSGLADLSVPAWLMAAAMVRPGGRLALVVPATWRSRNYADVIRYLMLRCFSIEYVAEDTQPGWFSDALIRTHLIVARGLDDEEISTQLAARTNFPAPLWLRISPKASTPHSLVGAAFPGRNPEAQFAAWAHSATEQAHSAITVRRFDLRDEWATLEPLIAKKPWYGRLEGDRKALPLFTVQADAQLTLPSILNDILPRNLPSARLVPLEEAGICVGQGLRTGCNSFFYVTELGPSFPGMALVRASSFFANREFSCPVSALRPVLHRQSEIPSLQHRQTPHGRVLDLRPWVLPEDSSFVAEAEAVYRSCGQSPPQVMPEQLAAYVRLAAKANTAEDSNGKRIPDLSAVRTNVRPYRKGGLPPRFWYMLPDFAARHLPAAFVPRVNDGLPWIETNLEPPILIDANFSTFWPSHAGWTRYALKALLNGAWCRAFMEALGTPLGGGALKLEATHLRQILVPVLSETEKADLSELGKDLTNATSDVQARIDAIILGALSRDTHPPATPSQLGIVLTERASTMSRLRRRTPR